MAEYLLWRLSASDAGDYSADADGYARLTPPEGMICVPWLYRRSATDPSSWTVKDVDGSGHMAAVPASATDGAGGALVQAAYITPQWSATNSTYPYGWQGNLPVWEFDLCVRIGDTWQTGRFPLLEQISGNPQLFPHLLVAGTADAPALSLALGSSAYPLDAALVTSGWVHVRVEMSAYTGNSSYPVSVYADGVLALSGSLSSINLAIFTAQAMGGSGHTWADSMTVIYCANPAQLEKEDLPVMLPAVRLSWQELSSDRVTVGAAVTLDPLANAATYQWDDTAGTQDASLTLVAPETGSYVLAVTDDAGQVSWVQMEALNPGVYASLVWSTGDSTVAITVTASGTYTVTVTNAAGSAEASYTVTFPGPVEIFKVFRSGDHDAALRAGPVTVQSQYAASPRILALAAQYWQLLDPTPSADLMISKMIDPTTAEGYGLDVWGRIVGIKRALIPVSGDYLAFAPPANVTNPEGDSWDNAPFNPVGSTGAAPDAVYRIYVFVKAMLNIGNGSLAELNRFFSLLYPDSGIKIIHSGTMIIRVLDFSARLTAADILALRTLDWVPLGVGWQLWQGVPDCFGFAGSELQPFDQAPFLPENALTIYD